MPHPLVRIAFRIIGCISLFPLVGAFMGFDPGFYIADTPIRLSPSGFWGFVPYIAAGLVALSLIGWFIRNRTVSWGISEVVRAVTGFPALTVTLSVAVVLFNHEARYAPPLVVLALGCVIAWFVSRMRSRYFRGLAYGQHVAYGVSLAKELVQRDKSGEAFTAETSLARAHEGVSVRHACRSFQDIVDSARQCEEAGSFYEAAALYELALKAETGFPPRRSQALVKDALLSYVRMVGRRVDGLKVMATAVPEGDQRRAAMLAEAEELDARSDELLGLPRRT